MHPSYEQVITRFLRPDERLIQSEACNMPLVIEASVARDQTFLRTFLKANSTALLADLHTYGAILLRGFDVSSDEDFETSVLSIDGLTGMRDAFMSEEGRVPSGKSEFVLHTNAVYKTGGTLYLGGFHSENYYSTDVPAYICFCCFEPSRIGGETGLVNMKQVYQQLSPALQQRLEKQAYFASEWLLSDVAKRYGLSADLLRTFCHNAGLPVVGSGSDALIRMYKPSVLQHPVTHKKSLFINLFEIHRLNATLRQRFMADYSSPDWFWHRWVWNIPKPIFKTIKRIYIACASFCHSPKAAMAILLSKIRVNHASKKHPYTEHHTKRVGHCFHSSDVDELATLIRQQYVSCLWKKGDILLVDNTQVMHAGMPGAGKRVIRAMICNPLEMRYTPNEPGLIDARLKTNDTLGMEVSR